MHNPAKIEKYNYFYDSTGRAYKGEQGTHFIRKAAFSNRIV
ncbi:hypothetical protein [Chitinophaga sp.]